MTETKTRDEGLKPCPICGSDAWEYPIYCTNTDCPLAERGLNYKVWNALPRQSNAVRDVVREMSGPPIHECGIDVSSMRVVILQWADRLSSSVESGSPISKTETTDAVARSLELRLSEAIEGRDYWIEVAGRLVELCHLVKCGHRACVELVRAVKQLETGEA